MINPKYITNLENLTNLSHRERFELQEVAQTHAFRSNEYYLSLIDWDDPNDPIRRLIVPDMAELEPWGRLDASNEKLYTKVPGLEHKYEHVALLLVNDVCGGICRFCFRKRIFMNSNDEVARDITPGLNYIRKHTELNNILLTGGDPLILSTRRLEKIISQLREIDHVQLIRIGSKMPAFNPFRILNDPALLDMFEKYSTPEKKIYLMTHFNHPRELTDVAIEALHKVHKAGVVTANQTPIIRGINDDPEVLAELLDKLSFIGVPPYYVFQCRPTQGNKHLAVPVERAYEIHEQAKMRCSGLAKRARYTMSHSLGKIEVLGLTGEHIIFKFHRAARPEDKAYIVIFRRNTEAYWYDDYKEMTGDYALDNPFYNAGLKIEDALLF
ncbi:MAG: KamA family radical SAM protein [Candidatus Latescibacteria bacterium]|nr:KamA family radical SAM protein [Candidatus Latescibacterota bacterium]